MKMFCVYISCIQKNNFWKDELIELKVKLGSEHKVKLCVTNILK